MRRIWFTVARDALRHARALGRRAADAVPLTPLGTIVALASAFALARYGLDRLDLVLFVMGALGLGLVALSLLAVTLATLVLSLRLRSGRGVERRVEAGAVFRTGFHAPPYWFLPLLRVVWHWEEPRGFEVIAVSTFGRQIEDVLTSRRGAFERIVRRIVIEDAFGLCRLALRRCDEQCLTVLPSAGQLRQMPVVRSMAAGEDISHPLGLPDGDRVDIRRYAAGDPVRLILWKTFARTRQLMVRTPERAISPARRTVGYLVAGPSDEAAAAAARVALESGALGSEWLFGADGSLVAVSELDAALSLIARSASAGAQGGARLEHFVRDNDRMGATRIVLFLPPRPGPWLDYVCALASRRKGLSVVVATDGIARPSVSALWRRIAVRSEARDATTVRDIDAVLTRLGQARLDVLLVDRSSGKVFGTAHQRALRAA